MPVNYVSGQYTRYVKRGYRLSRRVPRTGTAG